MFLSEAVAVFQLLRSFGSLCLTVYEAYTTVDPHFSILKALGLELKDYRDLYIANKQSCLHLTQYLELLAPTVTVLQTQYSETNACPPHLEKCVTNLESALKMAKELIHKNLLPSNLTLLQRQWWITKRIVQASKFAQRFSEVEVQIAQSLQALNTGVGIQTLNLVDQTSKQLNQQAFDYTEFKGYFQKQNLQIDQMTTTLLQVLEPKTDQATLQTLLASQDRTQTWAQDLRTHLDYQHQSQVMPILQQCLTQIETRIHQAGEFNAQFRQMQEEMHDLETQLAQHTDRILDTIEEAQLGLREFMQQLWAKNLNLQTQVLLQAIQKAYPLIEGNEPRVPANPGSWKYTFKEFRIEDLQIDFQDRNSFLGRGTGGEVFWGQLHFREIAFKRLALPQIWNPSPVPTTLSPKTTESWGSSSPGRIVTPASLSPPRSGVPSLEDDFVETAIKILKREALIVWTLNGQSNCVQLYGICLQPAGLIFEYCNAKTLQSWLYRTVYDEAHGTWGSKRLQILKMADKISLVTQLIQGLYYLHSKGYVHRDLKSGNCLIHNYGSQQVPLLNLKITDFGSSRAIADFIHSSPYSSSSGGKTQSGGTLRWLAPERRKMYELEPEQRKRIEAHPGIDIYGLGCIIGEIFTETAPFVEIERDDEIRSLPVDRLPYTEKQLYQLPEEIKVVIKRCCEGDVKRRVQIEELMYKEWPHVCGGLIGDRKEKDAERVRKEQEAERIRKEKEAEKHKLLEKVKQDGHALEYANELFKGDQEIVLAAVQQNGLVLQYASEALQGDKEIVMTAVQQEGAALASASENLKNDKSIVLAAVKQRGHALHFASEALKNDKEIVMAAIQKDGTALHLASPELRNDKEIVLAAIRQKSYAVKHASPELLNDKQFILAAVQNGGERGGDALLCAGPTLQEDKEFVLAAIQQIKPNYLASHYAEQLQELQKEKEMRMAEKVTNRNLILEQVKKDWKMLQCASEELKNDKQLVLTAVKRYGWALQYASEELKDDKEVVLAAVQQSGQALRFAGPELKNDREIVLAAVKVDGMALGSASPELQRDKEIALATVKQAGRLGLSFVRSPELRQDPEILKAVKG